MKLKRSKNKMIERFLQGFLIIILVILTIFMMNDVNKIQGNARVINYAGIIRGATQREIKLEISGNKNNSLIRYLDNIFDGLMDGGGKYQLTKLNDQKYQKKLVELNKSWISLKEEIQKVREDGYENTNIIEMSENYFYLADETVDAAGDTLIMNFAHIIRTSIPEKYFVGRYGGDEFIALLNDVSEDEVKSIIKKVQDEANRYNEFSKQIYIEFAYGYALSINYQEANLKVLLNQADKNMYECKTRMKQAKQNLKK